MSNHVVQKVLADLKEQGAFLCSTNLATIHSIVLGWAV